jgi:hypothetical protein
MVLPPSALLRKEFTLNGRVIALASHERLASPVPAEERGDLKFHVFLRNGSRSEVFNYARSSSRGAVFSRDKNTLLRGTGFTPSLS